MSKIGKGEWIILFIVAGITDIVQWVIDFTGVGAAINEVADPIIGVILAAYFFLLRGVSFNLKRVVSLVGATLIEDATASIAPAWIFDVWYIHNDVMQEEAAIQASEQQAEMLQNVANQPLNQDGMRAPAMDDTQDRPANRNGIRPAGNMQPLANVRNIGSGIDSVRPFQ